MIGKVLGTFNIFISPINNMAFPGNSDKFKTLNWLCFLVRNFSIRNNVISICHGHWSFASIERN